jgi:hypothetical protein
MHVSQGNNWCFITLNDPNRSYPAWDIVRTHVPDDKYCVITDIYSINHRATEWNQLFDSYAPYVKQGCKFIIDAAYEAPSYRHNLCNFMHALRDRFGIPLTDQIIFSGAQHQFDDAVGWSLCRSMAITHVVLKDSKATLTPEHHFISLARLAKKQRILATIEILDRGLDQYGYCSLGSGYYNSNQENGMLARLTPDRYKDRFPMFIDGLIAPGGFDYNQHAPSSDKMTLAFCNYAQETSYDHDVTPTNWNVPFITEKSTKPFAWGQVPVYLAPQGHVAAVRKMGFDLFDDIIDHSYDEEPDGYARITQTIDQLQYICSRDIKVWQQYKQENMERFVKNRQIAEDLYNRNTETMVLPNTMDLLKALAT